MGQKINPNGFRVGVIRDWTAKWYADKNYAAYLNEDLRIRKYIEKRLADTLAQREEVDKKSAQYDELTRAIEESQGQLNNVQKQISAYKNITNLLQKGNDFLASMGGLIYADEEKVLKADGIIRNEFDSFISRGLRFFNDLNDIRKESNILEGEFE